MIVTRPLENLSISLKSISEGAECCSILAIGRQLSLFTQTSILYSGLDFSQYHVCNKDAMSFVGPSIPSVFPNGYSDTQPEDIVRISHELGDDGGHNPWVNHEQQNMDPPSPSLIAPHLVYPQRAMQDPAYSSPNQFAVEGRSGTSNVERSRNEVSGWKPHTRAQSQQIRVL